MIVGRKRQYSTAGLLYGLAKTGYGNFKRHKSFSPYPSMVQATTDIARSAMEKHNNRLLRVLHVKSKPLKLEKATVIRGKRRTGSKSGYLRGKMRRARRKPSKTIANKFKSGVCFTKEFGKLYATGEVQYVGHITHPQYNVLVGMWAAVFKALFFKAGMNFKTLNDPLPVLTTDRIEVYFQTTVSGIISSYVFPVDAATNTVLKFAEAFSNYGIVPWYNVASITTQDQAFYSIEYKPTVYNPNTHPVTLDMTKMRVHYNIKSSLKMQNRSTTVDSNDQADDVDNVPLYGKRYSGSGTGARLITEQDANTFYGNTENGLIENSGDTENYLKEPPAPHLFTKVTKWTKVNIAPGDIKTSILTSTSSMLFNDLFTTLMTYTNYPNIKRKVGKFEFVALEKVLDATDIPDSIKIAIELQWTAHFKIATTRNSGTAANFSKEYL
ncbi:hypothetical protein JQ600_36590 [Bradyrhizobium sp. AUGA SZCCT0176]|uniref:hypothetical protein n=1 Tax=Bradyrhizobium sp. AUGA SZCCT0176 TaxID=2807664 RepID=UPI001BA78870|nr:hypothetical protein [Bradyrhizobium sp. AUGA SZCCT0176]MBR1230411.1 hypothetical protein [Bradyrhizobium sp. AUGA SZCCT0176]